jgi:hypothetical protein
MAFRGFGRANALLRVLDQDLEILPDKRVLLSGKPGFQFLLRGGVIRANALWTVGRDDGDSFIQSTDTVPGRAFG